jgi:hypothetical protein
VQENFLNPLTIPETDPGLRYLPTEEWSTLRYHERVELFQRCAARFDNELTERARQFNPRLHPVETSVDAQYLHGGISVYVIETKGPSLAMTGQSDIAWERMSLFVTVSDFDGINASYQWGYQASEYLAFDPTATAPSDMLFVEMDRSWNDAKDRWQRRVGSRFEGCAYYDVTEPEED